MKSLDVLKMCLNWKVLAGLGLSVLAIVLFVPRFAAAAPLLLILACPLSMIFMMRGMQHGEHGMKGNHASKPPEPLDVNK